MKNYKVEATKYFVDSNERDEKTGLKKERYINDKFYCTKERYEYLKQNNAVKLIKVEEPKKDITEEEVQAVANAIVEQAEENNKSVEEVVNEIVEESKEEIIATPKKKKSSKK